MLFLCFGCMCGVRGSKPHSFPSSNQLAKQSPTRRKAIASILHNQSLIHEQMGYKYLSQFFICGGTIMYTYFPYFGPQVWFIILTSRYCARGALIQPVAKWHVDKHWVYHLPCREGRLLQSIFIVFMSNALSGKIFGHNRSKFQCVQIQSVVALLRPVHLHALVGWREASKVSHRISLWAAVRCLCPVSKLIGIETYHVVSRFLKSWTLLHCHICSSTNRQSDILVIYIYVFESSWGDLSLCDT